MLPRLRTSLDFFPSPVADKPGLVIRDPFLYSDATLIVPPALAPCLEFFDGEHSSLDLREYLVRATGDLEVSRLEQHLIDTLSAAGFLEDDAFLERKEAAEKAFAGAPVREPAHAGSGYPDEKSELIHTFNEYLGEAGSGSPPSPIAIAAPHVSPFGGVEAYRAAYRSLSPADADRTFVVLGTSHYGQPDRLGLTRKPFVTPFGETIPDTRLIDELLAKSGDAAAMEDYCHSVEHSIEFQIVFLQHLCGSYATSIYKGGLPESNEHIHRMLGALGEMAAREEMADVARRDRLRMERMESGDARGFWDLVQENRDDLKWCGSAPIYTFLKAVPQARGELLHYQQWNIDEQSVVSFAGMRFT